jgi:hypothetical protein
MRAIIQEILANKNQKVATKMTKGDCFRQFLSKTKKRADSVFKT